MYTRTETAHKAPVNGRAIATVVALVGLAWGTVQALGVGDAGASGIVEESLGGPATGIVIGLFFIGVPALAVGVVDGLTVRIGRSPLRVAARILLVGGLGFWTGMWIYAFSDIDCDGTCIEPDRALVWSTLALGVVSLAAEAGVAAMVGRRARRPTPAVAP